MADDEDRCVSNDQGGSRQWTRREIVEKLLNGIAAGAAWPLLSPAHPIYEHLRSGTMLDQTFEISQSTNWVPVFLSTAENTELTVIAERIVPGSTSASVNRFIDLLLSVETAGNQAKFRQSLGAVENDAQKRFGRGFSALTSVEQESLLTAMSQSDKGSTGERLREHFENLKEWISGAYYSSEPGMRELGWDGTYAFASYPECDHSVGTN
jgi:Gluconate 2-dehydrogenase subunit 3